MNKNAYITMFVLLAALFRFIPHIPNFTPITAMALFGGVYFTNKKLAFIVPIIAMLLSDLFLGFSLVSIFVYTAFILISCFGVFYKKLNIKSIFLSSLIFFIITNFGVWLINYPKTITSLIECYTLAIPFFGNSLLGDLFYSTIMYFGFGVFYNKSLVNNE